MTDRNPGSNLAHIGSIRLMARMSPLGGDLNRSAKPPAETEERALWNAKAETDARAIQRQSSMADDGYVHLRTCGHSNAPPNVQQ